VQFEEYGSRFFPKNMMGTTSVHLDGREIAKSMISSTKPTYLRTDMMLVTLKYGDDALVFEKAEGGGKNEALTLHRLRRSDDAPSILRLLEFEGPVEVVCQPLQARAEPVGSAMIYQGTPTVVCFDILDSNLAECAFLTVVLDEWNVRCQ